MKPCNDTYTYVIAVSSRLIMIVQMLCFCSKKYSLFLYINTVSFPSFPRLQQNSSESFYKKKWPAGLTVHFATIRFLSLLTSS